jgi:molybdopterin synthase catalytic subunit
MRILFFGHLKDLTGASGTTWEPEGATTGEQLWSYLAGQYPALAPYRAHVRLARNLEYADWNTPLAVGDEVALIPPVSGG